MNTDDRLQADIERAAVAIRSASAGSLQRFLDYCLIPSAPEPHPFIDVRDPWQQEKMLALLVPAVEQASGLRTDYDGPRWFQFYLPRGHAKTSVQAMLVVWGLLFARESFLATCAAADRDQAKELRNAILEFVRVNAFWIRGDITVGHDKVTGPRGELEIISSDAASAYGKKRHLYICDEFTVWGDNRDLFNSLFSGADKIEDAVFVIVSNAGYRQSWQEEVKDTALADPKHWYVWEAPGHVASWMSPETREAKRSLLTPGEARRVLDNCWINPSEAGDFVVEPEVMRCEVLSIEMGCVYLYRAMVGERYVGAVDYGPRRDRSVCVIGHRDEARDVVVIDQMRIWAGFQFSDGTVPISEIEEWIEQAHLNFHLRALSIDQYEMESTIQKFQHKIPVERFQPRGGKGNYELAVNLRKLVTNTKLAWYSEAGELKLPSGKVERFRDELLSVQLRPMEYGFRIDNIKAGTHDDRCIAVGQMCMALNDRCPRQTDLAMATVTRSKPDRKIYGVERNPVSDQQRLYEEMHRTRQPQQSAAERRGLYGRGRRGGPGGGR